jgi:hypothetical protein
MPDGDNGGKTTLDDNGGKTTLEDNGGKTTLDNVAELDGLIRRFENLPNL